MNHRFSLLALAGLLIVTNIQAEVYRWVDQQGKVHYSDRLDRGGAQRFEISEPDSELDRMERENMEAEQKVQRQRLLDAYREEREDEMLDRLKTEAEERQRAIKCAQARKQLSAYESSRLYRPQQGGGRYYLSSDERRQELDSARAAVSYWCDS